MLKVLWYLSFLTFALAAASCTNEGSLSPQQVVEAWNTALSNGDIEAAKRYTSSTSTDYIRDSFGSLDALSKKYQTNLSAGKKKTIYEEEKVDADAARVIYTTYYPDGSIKRWEDTLFREEGVWKVAPQYVRMLRR